VTDLLGLRVPEPSLPWLQQGSAALRPAHPLVLEPLDPPARRQRLDGGVAERFPRAFHERKLTVRPDHPWEGGDDLPSGLPWQLAA
jgi:hypothetical protein